jgi:hypothetical protein
MIVKFIEGTALAEISRDKVRDLVNAISGIDYVEPVDKELERKQIREVLKNKGILLHIVRENYVVYLVEIK